MSFPRVGLAKLLATCVDLQHPNTAETCKASDIVEHVPHPNQEPIPGGSAIRVFHKTPPLEGRGRMLVCGNYSYCRTLQNHSSSDLASATLQLQPKCKMCSEAVPPRRCTKEFEQT